MLDSSGVHARVKLDPDFQKDQKLFINEVRRTLAD